MRIENDDIDTTIIVYSLKNSKLKTLELNLHIMIYLK